MNQMKKLLTVIGLIATILRTDAQSVLFFENENFEKWDSSQGYLDPLHWSSLNQLTAFGAPPTLERTTDAHSGDFAVLLSSKSSNIGAISGVITTGPLLDAQGQPDFSTIKQPYTYRPTKFQFYYKAEPKDGDSCIIAFVLTRWNLAMQRADTVAIASMAIGDSSATYQFADLTIDYILPLSPDSAFIIASSSMDGFNPTVGSKFYLDDLKLVGGSNGVSETAKKSIKNEVYPNPTNGVVHVVNFNKKITQITVFNLQGEVIIKRNVGAYKEDISLEPFSNGIYFLETQFEDGERQQKKVVKN